MNNLTKINDKDLQIKEFNGQRVVTFKDIDLLHERAEGTAKRNFNENRFKDDGKTERFIKGVDYFIVTPSEKDELRTLEIPNRGITLITESGYLMLVKSFTDDLAWEVQRQLVNSYFRTKTVQAPKELSAKEQLRLHYQAIEETDKKIDDLKEEFEDFKGEIPLFNTECKELQALVRKVGTKTLGGYHSPAYTDNSLRGKVYSDIQHQLRREFGVERYEAIKRSQLETARRIVEEYKAPTVLVDEIQLSNNQIRM